MPEACLGLGANLGDCAAQLASALQRLEATDGIRLLAVSPAYRTAPWGMTDQPDFLNLCIRIETSLAPMELLGACKAVEAGIGRQSRMRWGPREMDVDVLMMDGVEMDTPDLTLPHSRLGERLFVLTPLADIAADWQLGGRRIAELEAALRATSPESDCRPDPEATARIAAR